MRHSNTNVSFIIKAFEMSSKENLICQHSLLLSLVHTKRKPVNCPSRLTVKFSGIIRLLLRTTKGMLTKCIPLSKLGLILF